MCCVSGTSLWQTPRILSPPAVFIRSSSVHLHPVTSHPARAGTAALCLVPCEYSVFTRCSEVLLCCQMDLVVWSCHLAAQIVSHRVCLLPSKACVQPDVSVTYFIIGSNQHQSPGRRGCCCRWLLRAPLPCLSERLCQVLVN